MALDFDYENILDGGQLSAEQVRSGPGIITTYCDAYETNMTLEICCDLSEIILDDSTITSWSITVPPGYDGQRLTVRFYTPATTYSSAPTVNFSSNVSMLMNSSNALVTTLGGYDLLVIEFIEAAQSWVLTSIVTGFVPPVVINPDYHASAVTISAASFAVANLTIPPTPYYAFSIWLKTTHNNGPTMFVVDPNNYYAYLEFSSGTFDFRMASRTGSNGLLLSTATLPIFDNAWHHILFAMDNSASAMSGVCYVDDVLTHVDAYPQDPPTSAGNIDINQLPFVFGTDGSSGDNVIADFADFAFMAGSNLIVNGIIPISTRRKFLTDSHKPVDPEYFPFTPTLLLSGNASTIGINQGNGGEVVLTGTAPTNASTSPSD